MTEITVETTGNFQLHDRISGKLIPHDGPATVPLTAFIQERLELGQLRETDAAEAPPAPDLPEVEASVSEVDLTGTGGLHEALTGETPTELTGLAAALNPADTEIEVPDRANETPSDQENALEVPDRENDADNDGHDDKTGEFVDGNQEAAKPTRRGKRGK